MDANRVLIALSESDRTDFGRVAFAEQSDAQKVFSAVWELESQVNNGGFDQYFRYTDSDMILYVSLALKAIGASQCRQIVEDAIHAFGPVPATRDEREEVLDNAGGPLKSRLDTLDHRFFAYPDDLTGLLFAFVAQRPETFGPIRR